MRGGRNKFGSYYKLDRAQRMKQRQVGTSTVIDGSRTALLHSQICDGAANSIDVVVGGYQNADSRVSASSEGSNGCGPMAKTPINDYNASSRFVFSCALIHKY